MLGMNEAIFLDDKQKVEVNEIISRFVRKTGVPVDVALMTANYGEEYQGRHIGYRIDGKDFRKQPCAESWDGYKNRIKSYLFDIAM